MKNTYSKPNNGHLIIVRSYGIPSDVSEVSDWAGRKEAALASEKLELVGASQLQANRNGIYLETTLRDYAYSSKPSQESFTITALKSLGYAPSRN